jgi:hypothetical protein
MTKTSLKAWFAVLKRCMSLIGYYSKTKIFSFLISTTYELTPYRGACPGFSAGFSVPC